MIVTESVRKALAPTGTLRAAINLGNPLLAGLDGRGEPTGISVDLAQALADALAVPLSCSVFDKALESVDAVTEERCDVGFFAIDPLRGAGIAFSGPYLLIEGAYLVREASPLQDNGDVDRPGHRIVVGQGSAYDLFLSREIRAAELVRAVSSQAVVDTFLADGLEVAAGVRQQLEADARRVPGLRLLPGRFMQIHQAMGLPKSRGAEAASFLAAFVEERKASGAVSAAMVRHGVAGASVAPPS